MDSQSQEIGSFRSVTKQELEWLVTLGARCLLDGAVEEADWSARMVQDSGALIHRIADLTATSTDGALRCVRPHAENIAALMRNHRRLAASSWIDDYAKKTTDQIKEHGGIVRDEEDTPNGWEELYKHPATQQKGETLALVVCGLASLAFLCFLLTNPRILFDNPFGNIIGFFGLLTLIIASLVIFARIRSALRKVIRRRRERV